MFEGPEFAGATEASLNFVKGEHDLMCVTPGTELFDVGHRSKVWAHALITLHHDSCNL